LIFAEKTKIVDVDDVGKVLFEKSCRAKRVNIRVRGREGVRVAVPHGVSFRNAFEIVNEQKSWIIMSIERVEDRLKKQKQLLADMEPLQRANGRKKLISRLDELAEKHGFEYNRVFIRNQRTRWGSCSSRNSRVSLK